MVNTGSATWFDFAREIVRRAGVEATVSPCATGEFAVRAERPRYSVLDNAKVTAALGAMPAWQDALERYLRAKGHAKSQALDRRRLPGIPTRRRGALRRRQQ